MTDQTGPSLRVIRMRAYAVLGTAMAMLFGGYAAVEHGLAKFEQNLNEEKARQTPQLLETLAKQSLAERGFTDTLYVSHRLGQGVATVSTTTKKDGITYDAQSSCNSQGCYKPILEPVHSEPLATATTKMFRENGYAVAEWHRMTLNRDASKGRVQATVVKDGRSFYATVGCEQGRCRVVSMGAV